MTVRSVALGLLGAALICGVSFLNDRVLRGTLLVGNNMPVSVYGLLILFVMFVNPLLRRMALTGREIAVILALTLAACCVPGAGLLRTFTSSLVLPHHYKRIEPGWPGIVEKVPQKMLTDVSRNPDEVLGGFVQGMGKPSEHISFWQVPWYAWGRTLLFWLPVVLALWGALVGLSLMIHRQWSQHEHLPYPIAAFTDSLLPGDKSSPAKSVFGDRLFWIGTVGVLVIYLNNYAYLWFPESLVRIPTMVDLAGLSQLFPTFVRGGGTRLLRPTVYFTVIGIAYFVPKDVSLAFGVGPFLWAVLIGTLAGFGISLGGVIEGSSGYIGLKPSTFLLFGANLGVFLFLLYTGRHHYRTVLGRSLWPAGSRGDAAEATEVWGCRVFLGLMALFILQLAFVAGIGLGLAVLYAAVLVIFYVVMSRLIAEAGLFYIQPYFFPCVVLWGLFGARAIGPRTLLIMQMLTVVLVIDPRESLMPFVVNSLKLIELRQDSSGRPGLGRAAAFCALAVCLGLAIALPVTLYIQYDQGSKIWEGWGDRTVPKMAFSNALAVEDRLAAQGALSGAGEASGLGWLAQVKPNAKCLWVMLAGVAAVLVFSAARLRFNWWPLHPLLFVTWATYPASLICGTFMLGWLIKALVMKYGGGHVHNRLKPLMIGLIAGEVLGAVLPCIVSAVYYLATGLPPKAFRVLPT